MCSSRIVHMRFGCLQENTNLTSFSQISLSHSHKYDFFYNSKILPLDGFTSNFTPEKENQRKKNTFAILFFSFMNSGVMNWGVLKLVHLTQNSHIVSVTHLGVCSNWLITSWILPSEELYLSDPCIPDGWDFFDWHGYPWPAGELRHSGWTCSTHCRCRLFLFSQKEMKKKKKINLMSTWNDYQH